MAPTFEANADCTNYVSFALQLKHP